MQLDPQSDRQPTKVYESRRSGETVPELHAFVASSKGLGIWWNPIFRRRPAAAGRWRDKPSAFTVSLSPNE